MEATFDTDIGCTVGPKTGNVCPSFGVPDVKGSPRIGGRRAVTPDAADVVMIRVAKDASSPSSVRGSWSVSRWPGPITSGPNDPPLLQLLRRWGSDIAGSEVRAKGSQSVRA